MAYIALDRRYLRRGGRALQDPLFQRQANHARIRERRGLLLGVPEGTVKSRCHRARQALRAALAEAQAGLENPPHHRPAWETP